VFNNFCILYSCYSFNSCRCSELSKFVNKTADAGITALHMAALNGYFDCVQLLLDLNANASAATYHYGTSMDLIGKSFVEDDHKYVFFFLRFYQKITDVLCINIGAGSTPLHYAACGGNLKCCQVRISLTFSSDISLIKHLQHKCLCINYSYIKR